MLNAGDTIKCSNAMETIDVMQALEKEGYSTDFLYEKDGEKGLWIKILKSPSEK